MPVKEYAGVPIEINDEGFLEDSGQWTPDIAQAIANEVGVGPLSEQHWTVINFCRDDAVSRGPRPRACAASRSAPASI